MIVDSRTEPVSGPEGKANFRSQDSHSTVNGALFLVSEAVQVKGQNGESRLHYAIVTGPFVGVVGIIPSDVAVAVGLPQRDSGPVN